MSRKKLILIIAAVVIVLGAIGGGMIYKRLEYQANYIVIDEVEYSRHITELDLSGQTVTELEKLPELTELQTLNVRDTGLTVAQYDQLHYELLDCEILWSVPFQDGYLDNDTEVLTVEKLSEADLNTLSYLTNLKAVKADGCRDYEAIQLLMKRRPDLAVSYTVNFGGTEYPKDQQSLELTDPDVNDLMENLKYLPQVTTVKLVGTLPENKTMLQLQQAYPDVVFDYDFRVLGVDVNTLAEFVNLSNIVMENTDEVDAMMGHFYNLTQVDMVNCGISNEEMEALNNRYDNTKFVWTVVVSGAKIRTDSIYFMPWKYNIDILGNCYNLRYCTDMVILDFGHYYLPDLSFLEYMPKLEFLGLCQDPISDASIIGNCTNLKVLEIFLTRITDFWPLTNLTNLEDLNISYTPAGRWHTYGIFGDVTPLYQMTWLDRLWMANSRQGTSVENDLRAALPGTTLLFHSDGSTNRGWRYSPNYYIQRDILGMWYMTA